MKNWQTLEADVNKIMTKHYTKGRAGKKINKIIVHHNDGNLTVEGCWNVWQTREASAHYQVEADGSVGQLVWDSDTAWHAGSWDANLTSIGIEHADISRSPYRLSDATLENGAHLVAALCKKFGLGRPQWRKNVFPHSDFRSTECPASIAGDQNAQYMARAQYWYDQMTGVKPAPQQAPASAAGKSVDQLADEVIAGQWGNGAARRENLTKAGYNYDSVQARVNQIMTSKPATKTVDEIAREVIAGKWGNGTARQNALARAGYSYSAVQNRVNQILLG